MIAQSIETYLTNSYNIMSREITGHSIRTCLNKYRDKSEGPLFRNLDAQLPQMRLQIASLSLSLSLSNTLIHTYIHMCVCVRARLCSAELQPELATPQA